ncbi:hypothetical protein DMC25_14335 [Caulobacter sp. D4A]|uniref:hypothetical protein n=1 Tax=unclassified Caulobacter TaxID=2648921 RepID=UPI000D72DC29|nr:MULTISPECIES: hypothetical protein [unclassified Caulobacter]PXA86261.1 hypothetical protein DMC25_14335 [Caulobacter sp. D4A]PXA86507.1 hypothetical protein DMC18_21870 [Caulobacter sp. D5]
MLIGLLFVALLGGQAEPPDFAGSIACVGLAQQAAKDMKTLKRAARNDPAQLAELESAGVLWKRVGAQAARSAEETAASEGKSRGEQDDLAAQTRRAFETAPPELRNAMAESCIYKFARDEWDKRNR